MLKLRETVVKPTVLENCKSGQKLMDIDLSDNQNLISDGKTNSGFEVTGIINKLKKVDTVNVVFESHPAICSWNG